MAESTIDTEYVKQLEETVEVLTTHFDKDVRYGHWVDRHVDNDKKKTIIRSDLRVLGVGCCACLCRSQRRALDGISPSPHRYKEVQRV